MIHPAIWASLSRFCWSPPHHPLSLDAPPAPSGPSPRPLQVGCWPLGPSGRRSPGSRRIGRSFWWHRHLAATRILPAARGARPPSAQRLMMTSSQWTPTSSPSSTPAKFISIHMTEVVETTATPGLCREALTAARESPAGAGANSYSIFSSALCLSLVFAGSAGNKSLRFSTQYFI